MVVEGVRRGTDAMRTDWIIRLGRRGKNKVKWVVTEGGVFFLCFYWLRSTEVLVFG